jgi:hypothetical protein
MLVHFQWYILIGCAPWADTSDRYISPAGIAESVLAQILKILTNQVKHVKP